MATLYCPACGYNLTGLKENRCPECGQGFNPAELAKQRDEFDAGVMKSVASEIILWPILWALIAILIVLFLGLLIASVPAGIGVVVGIVMVLIVLAPPTLHSYFLADRYARARITCYSRENAEVTPRPVWMYFLLFSICECALMTFYFVGGCFLVVILFSP